MILQETTSSLNLERSDSLKATLQCTSIARLWRVIDTRLIPGELNSF